MVARDVFLFSFSDNRERVKVLEGEPWSFDYPLLVLRAVENLESVDLEEFCYTNFWVQAHDHPLDSRLPEVREIIGDIVGNLVRVHTDKDGRCTGLYDCVMSCIDITKPFRRVARVRLSNSGPIVLTKLLYEKLPDFCYWCGQIGHVIRACSAADVQRDFS